MASNESLEQTNVVSEELAKHDLSESNVQGSAKNDNNNAPTPFDMYRFLFPNRSLRRTWVERKWKQFEKAEAVQNEQHVKRWGADLQTRVRNYRRYLDKIIRESYYIKRMCVRYNSNRRRNQEGSASGSATDVVEEETNTPLI